MKNLLQQASTYDFFMSIGFLLTDMGRAMAHILWGVVYTNKQQNIQNSMMNVWVSVIVWNLVVFVPLETYILFS